VHITSYPNNNNNFAKTEISSRKIVKTADSPASDQTVIRSIKLEIVTCVFLCDFQPYIKNLLPRLHRTGGGFKMRFIAASAVLRPAHAARCCSPGRRTFRAQAQRDASFDAPGLSFDSRFNVQAVRYFLCVLFMIYVEAGSPFYDM
jgi:hypothetical protein